MYHHQNPPYKKQLHFREKSIPKQDNTWEVFKIKQKALQLSTHVWDQSFSSGNVWMHMWKECKGAQSCWKTYSFSDLHLLRIWHPNKKFPVFKPLLSRWL